VGFTIGRILRGGVRPVEIGHKIVRDMGDRRSVGVRGQPVVPNSFEVTLSTEDLRRFAEVQDSLVRELCELAREHAGDEGWTFMGSTNGTRLDGEPIVGPTCIERGARIRITEIELVPT